MKRVIYDGLLYDVLYNMLYDECECVISKQTFIPKLSQKMNNVVFGHIERISFQLASEIYCFQICFWFLNFGHQTFGDVFIGFWILTWRALDHFLLEITYCNLFCIFPHKWLSISEIWLLLLLGACNLVKLQD